MTRFTRMAVSFGILVLLTLVWTSAHAVTFTVTSTADSGSGTLREAIDMANANLNGPGVVDVIEFDLTLPDTISLTSGELTILDDLTINGPGADMLTVSGSNLSRIFFINDGDKITISGLKIADGNGVGAALSGTAGGAMLLSANDSEVELNDCVLENNSTMADSADGAITSITPEIKLVVNRCSFTNNSAVSTSDDFARGGVFGMTADRFTLEVNDSTFTSNYAQSNEGVAAGGVISLSREQLEIKFNNCTFDSNYVISNNDANDPNYGGAIGDFDSSGSGFVEITNSTFFGNYIECNAEECEVYGGAIGSGGNTFISCDHCTFLSNTVSCTGIDCIASGETIGVLDSDKITISNSIMSTDNAANNCIPVTSLGYNIDNGSSCVDGTETGDKANTDPMLDPLGLQDNGGLTETIALLPASMAIDMANPASVLTVDQRGFGRPSGAFLDIGAFEDQPVGKVTIVKETFPIGAQNIDFATSGLIPGDPLENGFTLNSDEQTMTGMLPADGTIYAFWETPLQPFNLVDIQCVGNSNGLIPVIAGLGGIRFSLADGDDVTCTFINEVLPLTHLGVIPKAAGAQNQILFEGGQSGEDIAVLWSFQPGSLTIGAGTCAGTELGIKKPKLLTITPADTNGNLNLPVFVPLSAVNVTVVIQGVALNNCRTSNVLAHTFTDDN